MRSIVRTSQAFGSFASGTGLVAVLIAVNAFIRSWIAPAQWEHAAAHGLFFVVAGLAEVV